MFTKPQFGIALAAVVFSSTALVGSVFANECDTPLHASLRNEYSLSSSGSLQEDTRTALCRDYRRDNARRTRISLDTVIQGIPMFGRFSREQREMVADNVCSEGGANFSSEQARQITLRIVPPEAYTSWVKCMAGRQAASQGFIATAESSQDGTRATVTLKWAPNIPIQNLNGHPVFTTPSMQVTGGRCEAMFKPNENVLPSQTVSCRRDPGVAFQAIVRTSYQDVVANELAAMSPVTEECTPELSSGEPTICFIKEEQKTLLACSLIGQPAAGATREATTAYQVIWSGCQNNLTIAQDLVMAHRSLAEQKARCGRDCSTDQLYDEHLRRFVRNRAIWQSRQQLAPRY